MLLVLDAGNTNIHFGLFEGATLRGQWRAATRHWGTSDELGVGLLQLMSCDGFDRRAVEGVCVVSVVPPIDALIREACARYFGREAFFVDPARHGSIRVLMDNPSELGADRLANTVAALALVEPPVVVVDFGTATTFDVVSAAGEYLGGAIAPGIEISVEALYEHTARLPRVDLREPERAVGRNTVEGMRSGIVLGYAGLVDRLVGSIVEELGGRASVIATGGLAPVIVPHARTLERIEPALTLEGARMIYEADAGGRARV